jgi:hypothetical protein
MACLPLLAQTGGLTPFSRPGYLGASASPVRPVLEFQGVAEEAGRPRFRLYDSVRKRGSWVVLNQHDEILDVTARHYSSPVGIGHGASSDETLVVEFQGHTLHLLLRRAKVHTMPGTRSGPPIAALPATGHAVPPSVISSVVVNPTAEDETKRLNAIAEEIRRRRALRDQATK